MKVTNVISQSFDIFKKQWWKIYLIIIAMLVVQGIGSLFPYQAGGEFTVSQVTAQEYRDGDITYQQLAFRASTYDPERAQQITDQYLEILAGGEDVALDIDAEALQEQFSSETVVVEPQGSWWANTIAVVVSVLLGLAIAVYAVGAYLAMVRKREKPLSKGLQALQPDKILKYVLTTLLLSLLMLALIIALGAMIGLGLYLGNIWAIAILSVVALVVFVVFCYYFAHYYFATVVAVDQDKWALTSLRTSRELLKGNIWKLVLMLLASMGLFIVGALLLFVGLLVTVPVITVMFYVFYEELLKLEKKESK
tara:strand:+ start:115 stop:1041 length:927 start_codon:yes stop_codon:yes gene_type:complete